MGLIARASQPPLGLTARALISPLASQSPLWSQLRDFPAVLMAMYVSNDGSFAVGHVDRVYRRRRTLQGRPQICIFRDPEWPKSVHPPPLGVTLKKVKKGYIFMQYGSPRAPVMVPWLQELYYTSIPMTLATASPVPTLQSTFKVCPVLHVTPSRAAAYGRRTTLNPSAM